MRVGVPREIKIKEFRVGLTPAGARELIARGHEVIIEQGAGAGIGLRDDDYRVVGAEIAGDAGAVYEAAELLVKVKEPQPNECHLLRRNQILFAYLHLAADPALTAMLMTSHAHCIAYETVTDTFGGLPLLAPMSEVAGRLSIQAAANALQIDRGGSGVLLGGVPGVQPGHVLVIGGGVVGINAARMAMALGARVTILDKSLPRLRHIDELFGNGVTVLFSTVETLEQQLASADVVIGAVLVPGAQAPKLVSRDQLQLMKPGSVLVDVAIDQGGSFETSRATSHDEPTYVVDGIVHYCVANMPGAVARTSTWALTNATLPYVISLADQGMSALETQPGLAAGLNISGGEVIHAVVAQALGITSAKSLAL